MKTGEKAIFENEKPFTRCTKTVRSFHVDWFVDDNDDDVIIRLIRIIIAIWVSINGKKGNHLAWTNIRLIPCTTRQVGIGICCTVKTVHSLNPRSVVPSSPVTTRPQTPRDVDVAVDAIVDVVALLHDRRRRRVLWIIFCRSPLISPATDSSASKLFLSQRK